MLFIFFLALGTWGRGEKKPQQNQFSHFHFDAYRRSYGQGKAEVGSELAAPLELPLRAQPRGRAGSVPHTRHWLLASFLFHGKQDVSDSS